MRIEIWSDVVCPWCYIGKRRLEKALVGFGHADEVEITWRSYQLDPAAPAVPTESTTRMLMNRYGQSAQGAQQMQDRVEATAAEEGLLYRLKDTLHLNTADAHRLLHLALDHGGTDLQGRLKEALLEAYFVRGANVADHAVLTDIATATGLDAVRVAEVLAGDAYAEAVQADIAQAQAYGAGGVPFFVIDGKYGVSGAQPAEAFSQVLERAWSESHPGLQMVGDTATDGDACGPDGCAI